MAVSKNSINVFTFTLLTLICIPYQTVSETKPSEKLTHLQFYFHDVISGTNPTAKKIIGINPYSFGSTTIINDPLTEGPNLTSKAVGKAQGIYAIASQNDLALFMVLNFVFTTGKYNGSSISLQGRNHVVDDIREMPIVGGSGFFRFARGYALAHTIWFDIKTGDATVKYDVFVKF